MFANTHFHQEMKGAMNIPNLLTLLRIILVPVIVIFLMQDEYLKALIVFSLAGLTDALDGALARLLNAQSELGSFLDPLADKVLLVTTFVSLSIFGLIPSWLTVIVISRDFIILLGIIILTMMSVKYEIKPLFVSKITTTLQILTVFVALLLKTDSYELISYHYVIAISWLTAIFTILSGGVYILKGIGFLNRSS
ncbi:MAG TPA: CDP-diacylglycerol--glycerol-3-phosphate 3-phosphatidyltransferase [Smithella sp.]|nr:CDP-diacylglycerol--glycerol-3-phosphate 3-phosphatidyltransferase [Smithella sp.]